MSVLPGKGADEDTILKGMRQHLTINEWFEGSNPARFKLAKLLGISLDTWPFPWNRAAAGLLEAHLDYLTARKHMLKRRAEIQRLLERGDLRPDTNSQIWASLEPYPSIILHGEPTQVERFGPNGAHEGPLTPPDYINDAAAAETIGPPGWTRPIDAGPTETIIQALAARTLYEARS